MADLHVALFMEMAESRLDEEGRERYGAALEEVRRSTEQEILELQRAFAEGDATPPEYVHGFDEVTVRFQERTAESVGEEAYTTLLDQKPGDWIKLSDPRIIEEQYGFQVRE